MPLIDNVKVCDPHTDTRRTFTDNLVNVAIPTDAADDWAELTRAHQELLKALFEHPAMAPNREQTFMTPARKKTRVYFMWDFVGRTLGMLYRIPPNLPASVTDKEDNVWMDVVGRGAYTELLITDPDHPKSKILLSFNIDEEVEFGDEVTRLARNIPAKGDKTKEDKAKADTAKEDKVKGDKVEAKGVC